MTIQTIFASSKKCSQRDKYYHKLKKRKRKRKCKNTFRLLEAKKTGGVCSYMCLGI